MIGRITVYLQQPSKYFIPSVAPSIKQLRSKYVSSCLHAHTLPLQLLAKLSSLRNDISLHYLSKPRRVETLKTLVRLEGLEPPRRKALEPKSSVSTNFTTGAISNLPVLS
jgi:hypothetical protein